MWCGALMNRRNYGRSSGVILDLCSRHGVWFDAGELERLLAWVREGGLLGEEKRQREEQVEADRRERLKRMEERGEKLAATSSEPLKQGFDLLSALGEVALEVLTSLVH